MAAEKKESQNTKRTRIPNPTGLRRAKAVTRDTGDVDIESSLANFEDHGGYCGCEIILNVATGDEKCLHDGYIEITDEEYGRPMRLQ